MLKPWIDLGWFTVPLSGIIKRRDDGSKTIPVFPTDWLNTYSKDRFTGEANIGQVLTGSLSNIIALDCDNTAASELVRNLVPEYDFFFEGKGKKDAQGKLIKSDTFIFSYSDNLEKSFSVVNDLIKLSVMSNNSAVYLPTKDNKTKRYISSEEVRKLKLQPLPSALLGLLLLLKPKVFVIRETDYNFNLNPMVSKYLEDSVFLPSLFKIITPKDFRALAIEDETLHPKDIPEGRGSEYLSKVSAILGSDKSIDAGMYINMMEAINDLFNRPMGYQRLKATIIDPMVLEKASINGKIIWKYDKEWEKYLCYVIDKRGFNLRLFYDDNMQLFYLVNLLEKQMKQFNKPSDLSNHLDVISRDKVSIAVLTKQMPLIQVVSEPNSEYGFFTKNNNDYFNSFQPTKYIRILRNPELFTSYIYPEKIMLFLESLVPDKNMRSFLLSFIKTKLLTFEYSPIILYFLGVSGSGKDLFVSLLEQLIGKQIVSRPTADIFLEKYNGWLLGKYIVQLDEFGNSLASFQRRELALGLLKTYTGSSSVAIRTMRTDSISYEHKATFILTSNHNPFGLDVDDRRIALFDCPNILKSQEWVKELGGLSSLVTALHDELASFCCYLATEISVLTIDEYNQPPETTGKTELILNKLSAAKKLAFILNNNLWDSLAELAETYTCFDVFSFRSENKVLFAHLFALFSAMTKHEGSRKALNDAMKSFEKGTTSFNGFPAPYWAVPNFSSSEIELTNITNSDNLGDLL